MENKTHFIQASGIVGSSALLYTANFCVVYLVLRHVEMFGNGETGQVPCDRTCPKLPPHYWVHFLSFGPNKCSVSHFVIVLLKQPPQRFWCIGSWSHSGSIQCIETFSSFVVITLFSLQDRGKSQDNYM